MFVQILLICGCGWRVVWVSLRLERHCLGKRINIHNMNVNISIIRNIVPKIIYPFSLMLDISELRKKKDELGFIRLRTIRSIYVSVLLFALIIYMFVLIRWAHCKI